jgi:hypothetical protein
VRRVLETRSTRTAEFFEMATQRKPKPERATFPADFSKDVAIYVGQAGQARVMSEFLIHGYNVAVPEIDDGDDLIFHF